MDEERIIELMIAKNHGFEIEKKKKTTSISALVIGNRQMGFQVD